MTTRQKPFYVLGVNTFDGTDWNAGEFHTREAAQHYIDEATKGKQMLMMHIYERGPNGTAKHVGSGGSF